ncbi:MAG: M48 family metallopeptidase [Candidatus Omnitrophota bacterium]
MFSKNFFLSTVICVLLTAFSGCATEYNVATQSEEWIYHDTDKEIKIGKSVAREIEKAYKISENPLFQNRVKQIGEKIAAVCDRKELMYYFNVIEAREEKDKEDIDEEVNAMALPGGYVYCFKGLFTAANPTDDELACVLAHEVGHIVAKHSLKKLQGAMGYTLLRIAAMASGSPEAGYGLDAAFYQLMMGYSQEDELLADRLGVRYARLAGYDPRGMITFLEKLQQINRKKPLRPFSYGRTHPYAPDRIRVVKEEIGEGMSFKDYINIEKAEHGRRY